MLAEAVSLELDPAIPSASGSDHRNKGTGKKTEAEENGENENEVALCLRMKAMKAVNTEPGEKS